MNVLNVRCIALPILILACSLCMASPAVADLIDSINPNAQIVPNTDFATTYSGIGWYYTPTTTYDLTGIYSQFQAIGPYGSGVRTMTVQLQTAWPLEGGTVLAQGSFTGDSAVGGTLGANFAPILLTAGTTYFVDFLGVGGMSLDIGQWSTSNGVHVASAGATTRLSDFFTAYGTDTTFSSDRTGNGADQSLATGNTSGLEPILFFDGFQPSAVPEPASLVLVATGLCGLLAYRRQRKFRLA